ISLRAPRAVELARSDARFRLCEHDLLRPVTLDRDFDVVRAMNILNKSYFDDGQIADIAAATLHSLRDGGLMVAGSNQDAFSPVRGAISGRMGPGFEPIWQAPAGPSAAHAAILSASVDRTDGLSSP